MFNKKDVEKLGLSQGSAVGNSGAPARKITVQDVAKLADVSTGTVSRVFNGNETVKPAVRERVLAAMKELNWEPSAVARSMRVGSTRAVGCIVSNVAQLTAAQMINGAEGPLMEAGYAMYVANSNFDIKREREILSSFKQRQIDGLIVTVTTDQDAEHAAFLEKLGVPIVLWERDANLRFPCVLSDHRGGCFQATSYLTGLGHSRIGLVSGAGATWVGREMIAGYVEAHEKIGLAVDPQLIYDTRRFDMAACSELLSHSNRPTAVIATINDLSLVASVARRMRFSVPDQLSIISVGDSTLISMTNPGVTAVRHMPTEVGRSAAAIMLDLLDNKSSGEKKRLVFSAELVVRESCAKL